MNRPTINNINVPRALGTLAAGLFASLFICCTMLLKLKLLSSAAKCARTLDRDGNGDCWVVHHHDDGGGWAIHCGYPEGHQRHLKP